MSEGNIVMVFGSLKAYGILALQIGRAFINLLYGVWHIGKLPRAPVSIFAGGGLNHKGPYFEGAHKLAGMLLDAHIPVIASECPGIMEVSHCRSSHKLSALSTITIGTKKLHKSYYYIRHLTIYRLFARKFLLINYSSGFAVFPGGFGTLSELMQTLTLIETKMRPTAPVILVGTEYWEPFVKWVKYAALKQGLLTEEEAALFIVTDDVAQVFSLLVSSSKKTVKLM
jgi:uncharacterized protein (TIGR00730 family)